MHMAKSAQNTRILTDDGFTISHYIGALIVQTSVLFNKTWTQSPDANAKVLVRNSQWRGMKSIGARENDTVKPLASSAERHESENVAPKLPLRDSWGYIIHAL